MINISDISNKKPYKVFSGYLNDALKRNQKSINAIAISSFNVLSNEVDSRYVNLKYIADDEWIFFSNYESSKSKDFKTHDQISALLYWNSVDIQIRMKAKIRKTCGRLSDEHFMSRSYEKNALAMSSNQSMKIKSYNKVKENYEKILKNYTDDQKRPNYWGGYSFTPFYFEFWEGHKSRLNKRNVYQVRGDEWIHSILEP